MNTVPAELYERPILSAYILKELAICFYAQDKNEFAQFLLSLDGFIIELVNNEKNGKNRNYLHTYLKKIKMPDSSIKKLFQDVENILLP